MNDYGDVYLGRFEDLVPTLFRGRFEVVAEEELERRLNEDQNQRAMQDAELAHRDRWDRFKRRWPKPPPLPKERRKDVFNAW